MWSNTKAENLRSSLKRLNKIKLSKLNFAKITNFDFRKMKKSKMQKPGGGRPDCDFVPAAP